MHSGLKKGWGLVLAAALLLTLSGGIVGTAWAEGMVVERALPEKVAPGETFDVIITFAAPADNFHGIVLFDGAPDTPSPWSVELNVDWCTPQALSRKIYAVNEGEYTWLGPYTGGTEFTARYRVTVPDGAAKGTYDFDGWLGYYIEEIPAPPYIIPITGDLQIEVAVYDLTIDSTVGGEVTTPGEGTFTYDPDDGVDIVAVADACYKFVNWTGDVGTIADPASSTTTITMSGDYSITARFEKIRYDLTVGSTAGGSVTTPGEGTFDYDCGDVVDLEAVAGACYEFTGWTGPVADPNSPNTTITMNDDYSVTANFALIQYDLTVGSTGGGSVTDPGEGTFARGCGTVVDLVAEAGECYEFTGWTGETDGIADPSSATTTITMAGNYTITANFAVIEYELTVGSTAGGSVADPGEDTFTYDCGTVVDLVAVADECYEFRGWTGDIGAVANAGSSNTTITMAGNYTITATFGLIQYDLTTSSTAGGSVTVPVEGTSTHDCGDVVPLVAVAANGYEFVGWTGDIEEIDDATSADTSITMLGNYSITAEFSGLARVEGETWEVNCEVLPGVTITLLQNGTVIGTTESDGDGNYELALGFGDYTVVASKAGFRDEEQHVSVTAETAYFVNFFGNHGLIPNQLDGSYFARCMSVYLFAVGDCAIDGLHFGRIMSAYLASV